MNELSEKIIDRTEEMFLDTINMDIEIVKDRLSYITWLTCVIHRHPFNYTGCLWTEKSNKDYSG